jgi:hypothetical protein
MSIAGRWPLRKSCEGEGVGEGCSRYFIPVRGVPVSASRVRPARAVRNGFGLPKWSAVAGVALGGSLVAAVVGFRAGAVKLAQSRKVGDPRHHVSIFSEPLSQEQVDQYYVNYRGGQRRAQLAVALRASRPNQRKRREAVVASRLSA